jgi:hypothetical protein
VRAIFALRLGNENHPLLCRDADRDFSNALTQSDRDYDVLLQDGSKIIANHFLISLATISITLTA